MIRRLVPFAVPLAVLAAAPTAQAVQFSAAQPFTVSGNPVAVAVGDITGDGRKDLVAASSAGVTVLRATGTSPAFVAVPGSPFAFGSGITDVALADFNADGKLDVVTANADSNDATPPVTVGRNTTGAGTVSFDLVPGSRFNGATGNANAVFVGLIQGKAGAPDIAFADQQGNAVGVLVNDTRAASEIEFQDFEFPAGATPADLGPTDIASADIDDNGIPDLVASLVSGRISVFLNSSKGTGLVIAAPITVAGAQAAGEIDAGDLDADGRPDVVTASESLPNGFRISRNTTVAKNSATFAAPAAPNGSAEDLADVLATDLDEDGKRDLVGALADGGVVVRPNTTTATGSPIFGPAQTFAGTTSSSALVVDDLNGDSNPDLVVADGGAPRVVLLLRTPEVRAGGATVPLVTYLENAAPVAAARTLEISAPGTNELKAASVRIGSGLVAGRDQLTMPARPGIATSYDAAKGLLRLSGKASVASYRAALRSVAFSTTGDAPGTARRGLLYAVSDGLFSPEVLAANVDVTAVNDVPSLAASSPSATLAPDASATAVDPGLAVVDPDSANLVRAVAKIGAGYVEGEDFLRLPPRTGFTATFSKGTLTITGTRPVEEFRAALRSVTFDTVGTDQRARTISFVTTDGDDGTSAAASRTLAVAPNGGSAAIDGTPAVGQVLTARNGAFGGSQPVSLTYRWQRCDAAGGACVGIDGATGSTYTVTSEDVGSTLRVRVTGRNAAPRTATATSAPTGVVPAPAAGPGPGTGTGGGPGSGPGGSSGLPGGGSGAGPGVSLPGGGSGGNGVLGGDGSGQGNSPLRISVRRLKDGRIRLTIRSALAGRLTTGRIRAGRATLLNARRLTFARAGQTRTLTLRPTVAARRLATSRGRLALRLKLTLDPTRTGVADVRRTVNLTLVRKRASR